DADELVRNFVRLVAEKDRIGELNAIYREWERLLAAEERVIEVELTTAVELSDEEAAGIVLKIEQATGRTVEAIRRVDPDLIGGLVLQAGSLRIDGSVRGRLEGLRQELLARA
ncbi:MAG: ATP synthase F1 subunit delta, partial [Actinomycetota bacterium]|nr:ATP synthase F1 subunit delta [Actinomycetota bacterium]